MPVFAVIMAAGKGQRFGSYKQFMIINGKLLLCYVLDIFKRCKKVDKIIVAVPREKIPFIRKLMKNNGFSSVKVIAGGRRRQDSVFNGIKSIDREKGIVVIHDCVRPIINPDTIQRGIQLCKKYHAVILGTPITDTIKSVRANKVINTINRKQLYLVQTPQFFDLQLLRKAYALADLKREYTDEAGLLESVGTDVYLFRGNRLNIKITYKQDIQLANCLL